jgi:hypothetical protein
MSAPRMTSAPGKGAQAENVQVHATIDGFHNSTRWE